MYVTTSPNPEDAPSTPRRAGPPRRRRADQLEANRGALVRAAAKVVGEQGYSKASINKITASAGLGLGTFYTYFASRQELFDILLPEVSEEMRGLERARVVAHQSLSLVEVETESFRAFADYVLANPWYARILFEAETMAPAASLTNGAKVLAQHSRRLEEAWRRGELPQYARDELPALSTVLLNFRRHFVRTRLDIYPLPVAAESLIEVSVRVIADALQARPLPATESDASRAD